MAPKAKKASSKGSDSGKKEDLTKWQKKTPIEHILLRPDSYVGSTEASTEKLWLFNSSKGRMELKTVTFVPAMYKIFDEILVNAADNFQRDPKRMDYIKVTFSQKEGKIVIENNGRSLPVQKHEKEKMYLPEMVFGHLLTSDKFDDSEKRVVGGRNGYGAKLCNVYSKHFRIECADGKSKKIYKQDFFNNMKQKEKPKIDKFSGNDWTRVTFWPDFQKFGMKGFDNDTLHLLQRRVYDIAGTTDEKVKVFLNGSLIRNTRTNKPITNFEEYCQLFDPHKGRKNSGSNILYMETSKAQGRRWQIAVGVSETEIFQQVSFVNSIHTSRGGTHVKHVADQIVEEIARRVNKRTKGSSAVANFQIKNHLKVFVNCLIENPAFDSQTKETMKTVPSKFGSACDIKKKFFDDLFEETDILTQVNLWAKQKANVDLEKQMSRLEKDSSKKKAIIGIPKLEDANDAGGEGGLGEKCTLILTEGDSAKALAVAGLSVVGRDRYGVFPLKGKLLNVRDADSKMIMENQEVKNILTIMGLQPSKKYNSKASMQSLRYGSIMIMADQDYDGSHIKGLLINLIAHFWPELLKQKGFIKQFITPIVKIKQIGAASSSPAPLAGASKRASGRTVKTQTGPKKIEKCFFSLQEFEAWKLHNKKIWCHGKGWNMKYYKGLGTSTSAEAKEYFNAIDHHRMTFDYDAKTEKNLDLAFNKKRADDRKNWISKHAVGFEAGGKVKKGGKKKLGTFKLKAGNLTAKKKKLSAKQEIAQKLGLTTLETGVDYSKNRVSYSDFVNKELVQFAKYDNVRAIPCVLDGFKPSQRKVLFACFKKRLHNDMKVAQLCGYVAEHAAYHHGEASLQGTITSLAQDFCGSNNLNLLVPSGQFGTRNQGGNDKASARYIFTRLQQYTRKIFHPDDDPILDYLDEEGQLIEPKWYLPILPMVLVNGADGIGSGWSTSIPNFNPRDIINNIKRVLGVDVQETVSEVETNTDLDVWHGNTQANRNGAAKSKRALALLNKLKKKGGRLSAMKSMKKTPMKRAMKMKAVKPLSDGKSLDFRKMRKMTPWYRGFTGDIKPFHERAKTFEANGVLIKLSSTVVEVRELPVKKWTQDYKEFLTRMTPSAQAPGKSHKAGIKGFREYHTDTSVHFVITMSREQMTKAEEKGMAEYFRMKTFVNLTNLMLFDRDGRIRKYDSAEEILADFIPTRLEYYGKRKHHLLMKLGRECEILQQRRNFVAGVVNKTIKVADRKKDLLLKELRQKRFLTKGEIQKKYTDEFFQREEDRALVMAGKGPSSAEADSDDADSATSSGKGSSSSSDSSDIAAGYDYLLGQAIWSLTTERIVELTNNLHTKQAQIRELKSTSLKDMWNSDLDDLLRVLDDLPDFSPRRSNNETAVATQKKLNKGGSKPLQILEAISEEESEFDENLLSSVDENDFVIAGPKSGAKRKNSGSGGGKRSMKKAKK